MNILERSLLGLAILEIPLQVDAYYMYQEHLAESGAVNGINVSITTICLVGLYALWLWDAVTLPRPAAGRKAFSFSLAAYLGVVALSSFVAEIELLAISYFALLLQAFMLLLYIANRIQNRNDVVFVMGMLAVSLALQGSLIVASALITPRLMGNPIALGPVEITAWPDGRLCGTLTTPVAAGSYLALLLLPVASLRLTPVSTRLKSLALVAAATGTLAVCLTQSRGSVLAVVVAVAVFGALMLRRRWLPKWAIATALLLAALAAYPLVEMFQNRVVASDQGSAESRIHLAQIAWQLIQDHAVVGVGAGNYYEAAETYANASPFRSEWFYTVHCTYLLAWAEVGAIGLCAFVGFLAGAMHCGWKIWQLRDPLLSVLALAIAVTILGQMVHMFVDLFNSRAYIQTLSCTAGIVFGIRRLSEAGILSTIGNEQGDSSPLWPATAGPWRGSFSPSQ
jgi:hypothetical protein